MHKTLQISIVTGALALGLLLGAILFRTRHEEPPRAEKAPRPAPAAADRTTAELARANERIAALEDQLRTLHDKVEARAKEKDAVVKELRQELVSKATTVFEGELDGAEERPFGWRVPHRPQSIAGILGLDAARRKALDETYRSFVERIRALEKQHSKTTVDGDTTRIDIAPFPAEGKALIDDWSGQLTALLTPDEKDRYKRLSLGLLPADVGQHERVIAIVDEGNGMATATEQTAEGSSGYYKGPKGMALSPYRHLLKN
jgi:hypothetical protein